MSEATGLFDVESGDLIAIELEAHAAGAIEALSADSDGHVNGLAHGLGIYRLNMGFDAGIVGAIPRCNSRTALEMPSPIVENRGRRETCDHAVGIAAIAARDERGDRLRYSFHGKILLFGFEDSY